ncbi:MAG: hypothetical protein OEW23_12935 [Candidatus Aminicenantes bacterium]|nr:hypothetical protein [Candidatus Aminicenantes bacterium]
MRPLEKGEKVRFMAYSLLGDDYEEIGTVVCDAVEGIKNKVVDVDPAEYAELEEGDAYILETKDKFGNNYKHLVYISDMIEVLPEDGGKEIDTFFPSGKGDAAKIFRCEKMSEKIRKNK